MTILIILGVIYVAIIVLALMPKEQHDRKLEDEEEKRYLNDWREKRENI